MSNAQLGEESFNVSNSNEGFNGISTIQIRLDTTQIIENIELFLRGAKIILAQDINGETITQQVSIGRPKANDLGIQSILNWIQLIINTQVVQGNFPVESGGRSLMYDDYIYNVRIDFTEAIIINCYNWEIQDEDIGMIVDSVMNIVEPFVSRLIDNKERDSYSNTIKSTESNTVKEGGKKFNPFASA